MRTESTPPRLSTVRPVKALADVQAREAELAKDVVPPLSTYLGYRGEATPGDSFTNEAGLPTVLHEQVAPTGGAVVGVSGALLDVAAQARANLVVSVDSDPRVRDSIDAIAGLLLRNAKARGLTPEARAEALQQTFASLTSPDEARKIATELHAMGVSQPTDALVERLQGIGSMFEKAPKDVWLKGEDAADAVQHLTSLAKQGRILGVTADLTDNAAAENVRALLDQLGEKLEVLHLSNAPDYAPDVRGIARTWRDLPWSAQGQVVTSSNILRTFYGLPGLTSVHGDDAVFAEERPRAVSALGTFGRPAVHSVADALGEGGLLDRVHDAAWENARRRYLVWESLWENILPHQVAPGPPPESVEALREDWDALWQDPEVRGRIARAKIPYEQQRAYEAAVGFEKLYDLLPSAVDRDAPEQALADFDRKFWSKPGRSTDALAKLLRNAGYSEDEARSLAAAQPRANSIDALFAQRDGITGGE